MCTDFNGLYTKQANGVDQMCYAVVNKCCYLRGSEECTVDWQMRYFQNTFMVDKCIGTCPAGEFSYTPPKNAAGEDQTAAAAPEAYCYKCPAGTFSPNGKAGNRFLTNL
jgi:hypothetical protein